MPNMDLYKPVIISFQNLILKNKGGLGQVAERSEVSRVRSKPQLPAKRKGLLRETASIVS